jgi:hypothetical protein
MVEVDLNTSSFITFLSGIGRGRCLPNQVGIDLNLYRWALILGGAPVWKQTGSQGQILLIAASK